MSPEDSIASLANKSIAYGGLQGVGANPDPIASGVEEIDITNVAKKRLLHAMDDAITSLLSVATFAEKDADRFRASTYIIDRCLGPVGKGKIGNENDPMERLVADLQNQASKMHPDFEPAPVPVDVVDAVSSAANTEHTNTEHTNTEHTNTEHQNDIDDTVGYDPFG